MSQTNEKFLLTIYFHRTKQLKAKWVNETPDAVPKIVAELGKSYENAGHSVYITVFPETAVISLYESLYNHYERGDSLDD